MSDEQVKFFNEDGTETIRPLDAVMTNEPEEKLSAWAAVAMILGSLVIVCGTFAFCVWAVTSNL